MCNIQRLSVSFHVKLPNGQFSNVTHIGTVRISEHLTLIDVLCVPSFLFNLLSASKIIKCLHYCVVFLANFCFIQNLVTWVMIGVGEETNGLYYLLQKPTSAIVSAPSSQFVPCFPFSTSIKNVTTDRHYRLGHLSDFRFKMIHVSNLEISCNFSNTCIVCPLGKQKCIPFPISSFTSNKIFYLIHCDIWGPFSISSRNDCHFFLTIVDDFSRYTWIHLMQSKGQTRTYIQSFSSH
jgi:hypothetical protein